MFNKKNKQTQHINKIRTHLGSSTFANAFTHTLDRDQTNFPAPRVVAVDPMMTHRLLFVSLALWSNTTQTNALKHIATAGQPIGSDTRNPNESGWALALGATEPTQPNLASVCEHSVVQRIRGFRPTKIEDKSALKSEFGDLLWALAIDGKDAPQGPNIFGYNRCGFALFLAVYPYALGEAGNTDLSLAVLEDLVARIQYIRHKDGYRAVGGKFQTIPTHDHMPECFHVLSCDARSRVIATVPAEIVDIRHTGYPHEGRYSKDFVKNCTIDFVTPRNDRSFNIRDTLDRLITNYTRTLKNIPSNDLDGKIMTLARLLKSFAWLHPFPDGNGRLRTIILQRELRRLGLGHAAFMYNNNRDVYFIDDEMYVAKIKEGIRMADIGLQTKANPWQDTANRKAHRRHFPTPFVAPGECIEKISWAFPEADAWSAPSEA